MRVGVKKSVSEQLKTLDNKMEPQINLKSIGKTTISIVIVEEVEGSLRSPARQARKARKGWGILD